MISSTDVSLDIKFCNYDLHLLKDISFERGKHDKLNACKSLIVLLVS